MNNKKSRRKAPILALATALLVGGVGLAGPAHAAGPWGGYITWCTRTQVVTAIGTKGTAAGSITVSAPGRSVTDSTSFVGDITVRGGSQVGQWGVSGSAATAGRGTCS